MSRGDFPESSSRAMLVGTMLVGRLGVPSSRGDLVARIVQEHLTNRTFLLDTHVLRGRTKWDPYIIWYSIL